MNFIINGHTWTIIFVNSRSKKLIDRTGKLTLATTSPAERAIYISEDLEGRKYDTVLKHELTHVVLYEYDLLYLIRAFTKPEYKIDMEEIICNIVADHMDEINYIAGQS